MELYLRSWLFDKNACLSHSHFNRRFFDVNENLFPGYEGQKVQHLRLEVASHQNISIVK